jgi:hypothetical protein
VGKESLPSLQPASLSSAAHPSGPVSCPRRRPQRAKQATAKAAGCTVMQPPATTLCSHERRNAAQLSRHPFRIKSATHYNPIPPLNCSVEDDTISHLGGASGSQAPRRHGVEGHRRMEARQSQPQGLAGPPGLCRTHHQRLPRRRPRRLPHPEVAGVFRGNVESEWTAARRNRAAAEPHISEAGVGHPAVSFTLDFKSNKPATNALRPADLARGA